MAIKKTQQGFALLVAVIFMSVMLTLGLALSSLGYKQQVLASGAVASQYAFYVADAALECALHADQRLNLFAFPPSQPPPQLVPSITCDGSDTPVSVPQQWSPSLWILTYRLSLDAGTHCADVTVYKPSPNSGTTYIFSQGYDVSCSTVASPDEARFVSRGLNARY
ncbi:MAG: pilus assembly PilX N-terminal domain-containing protein [Patescibacteria group bacterium]